MVTNHKIEGLNPLLYPIFVVTFLLLIMTSTTLFADKVYRWQDAEGNWHYTDTIPPEQIKQEHSQLDQRGIQVEKVGRVKSLEEIAKEAALEKLRAKQQQIIERQLAEDRVLLRTFRSGDDIIMARDGKLRAVDVQIHLIESNNKRLKQKLGEMQQKAAKMELSGTSISSQYLKEIEVTHGSLKEAYASIIIRKQRKVAIHEKYNHDLKRFLELRELSSQQADDAINEKHEELELQNVLNCVNESDCDQAWPRAEQFVRLHATTPIQIIGHNIIMTAPPKQASDISITISRTHDQHKNDRYLFMDLQCINSELGAEFCASERVERIRSQFLSYVRASQNNGKLP